MAVQRLYLARDSAWGGSQSGRGAILAYATVLLLLVAGNAAIHRFGPANHKQQANRIVSPQDTSMAPPAFVPSEAVKVKRSARVTVIPERRRHHQQRRTRRPRTPAHTVHGPRTSVGAVNVPSSMSQPAEPP